MRGLLLFSLGFVALAAAYQLGEEIQTLDETDGVLTHDDLRRLFENDDPSAFNSGISQQLGDNAPSLEELTAMFNTFIEGTVPQYITDHGFILNTNVTGTYDYSHASEGTYKSVNYGLIHSEGKIGTYSSIVFTGMQSTRGPYHYSVGTALFSIVSYSKDDSSVAWQGGTEGVFLFKMRNGTFATYGNYTGGTQGVVVSNAESAIELSLNTLGIMDTIPYSSKTITNVKGESQLGKMISYLDMFSMTGGSNATMSMYSTTPAEGSEFHATSNGTISNFDRSVTMHSTAGGYVLADRVNPFSDTNLPNYFGGMYYAIGIYIP